MIISNKYNFIFFATPHTGSSTIQRMLEPIHSGWQDFADGNHLTPDRVRGLPRMMGLLNWDRFLKVGFIRNPWDRYVALMMYANKLHRGWDLPQYDGLEGYIKSGGYEGMHQHEFLLHFDGTQALDFVGRFENFNQDVRLLFKTIGLPRPKIVRHENDSKYFGRMHYTKYYTEQWMIDEVAHQESYVISRYGYKFGEDGNQQRRKKR